MKYIDSNLVNLIQGEEIKGANILNNIAHEMEENNEIIKKLENDLVSAKSRKDILIEGNTVLPAVFSSVDEAVKLLKLDKRHKWEEWNGELSYPFWYTAPCSGCSCDCSDGYGCNHGNSGCHECGYTGKRRNVVPVPAFMPDGSTVKVVPQNGR